MKQLKRKFIIFLLEQILYLVKKWDIKDNLLLQGLRDIRIWLVRERKK